MKRVILRRREKPPWAKDNAAVEDFYLPNPDEELVRRYVLGVCSPSEVGVVRTVERDLVLQRVAHVLLKHSQAEHELFLRRKFRSAHRRMRVGIYINFLMRCRACKKLLDEDNGERYREEFQDAIGYGDGC